MPSPSFLVADDHALMRDALCALLERHWAGAPVSTAHDWEGARSAAASPPTLCIVDLVMGGARPIDGLRGLMEAYPESRILVVSGSATDSELLQILRLGVSGFVEKTSDSAVLKAAIELVLAGGSHFPARVFGSLAEHERAPAGGPGLTERQKDVLRLLAQGLSNKDIARKLGISPATAKTHVAHAMAAVGAGNRTEAAMKAKELDLL